MRVGACRSCGATIVWARTERGKKMPVDYPAVDRRSLESDRGLFVLRETGAPDGPMAVASWPAATQAGDELYLSHFSTCSNAAEHRKAS